MPKAIRRRDAGKPIEGLSALMSRLYANRGVTRSSQVDYSLKNMLSPDGLLGIDTAAKLQSTNSSFSIMSIASAEFSKKILYFVSSSGN